MNELGVLFTRRIFRFDLVAGDRVILVVVEHFLAVLDHLIGEIVKDFDATLVFPTQRRKVKQKVAV